MFHKTLTSHDNVEICDIFFVGGLLHIKTCKNNCPEILLIFSAIFHEYLQLYNGGHDEATIGSISKRSNMSTTRARCDKI